jgi:hypothetical protein
MRISNLPVILILAICCLCLTQEANAQTPQTYSYSDITFDDATGVISSYSYTQPDYRTNLYYYTSFAEAKIRDAAGTELAHDSRQTGGGSAEVRLQTDAYADEEYTVQAGHAMYATYYKTNYYYQGSYVNGWSDYYNYSYYEGGGINAPGSFTFYGYGPETMKYSSFLFLGQSNKKVKVGTPHHLKVVSDATTTQSCGSKRRLIKYRVVDSNGRGTGRTGTLEEFTDPNNSNVLPSIFNSCQNSNFPPPPCSTDAADATFIDQLWVGCPSSRGDCGFPTVISNWYWCPTNRARKKLASMTYAARHSSVLVNGSAQLAVGTDLF